MTFANVSPGAVKSAHYSLIINSLFDPTGDFSSNKPEYYTWAATMYYGYMVRKCKTVCRYIDGSGVPKIGRLAIYPSAFALAAVDRSCMQMKGMKWDVWNGTNATHIPTVSLTTDITKTFPGDGAGKEGVFGSSPSFMYYHNIILLDDANAFNLTGYLEIVMYQEAVLFDAYKPSAESTTNINVDDIHVFDQEEKDEFLKPDVQSASGQIGTNGSSCPKRVPFNRPPISQPLK